MRIGVTLSARIVLGFAILTVTFAGISIATFTNMDRLDQQIRVIRTGYLQLALKSRDLAERQTQLHDYLTDDLEGERNARRVRNRLQKFLGVRERLLADLVSVLDSQSDLPDMHVKPMRETRERLAGIRTKVSAANSLYNDLIAEPPLEARSSQGVPLPPAVAQARHKASEALVKLRRAEQDILLTSRELGNRQRRRVAQTAQLLERGSRKIRSLSIYFGLAAIASGLAFIVIAILTLRPLRRLPAAAQRIGRGEYDAKIPERGPREVAELAREFNKMGSALQQRERDLVNSERLATVGKISAMITHEIRNPLSSIGLNTEELDVELSELGEPDTIAGARELCRAIHTEVDRLTGITETYLQFARLPQPKLHREDVNGIVRGLANFERENLAKQEVELVLELGEELPMVEVDNAQIRQALLNLLRNAAEAHGGDPGKVTIRSQCDAATGDVTLEVEDNGPGIASDVAAKLGEPFFSTKAHGTGLGLALTFRIVREHGGELTVDSEPGVGARFTMRLPRVIQPSVLGA